MTWKVETGGGGRITSREMKVLLVLAILATATHFFGTFINGLKHHNHKPCRSRANPKQELQRGRFSTRSKPLRGSSYGQQYDSYNRSQFTRNKRREKVSKLLTKDKRKEMGVEPNAGKLSKSVKPSNDQPYHYVVEVEQNDRRKKGGEKNLRKIANINRLKESDNAVSLDEEGEKKQLDIPGCGGWVELEISNFSC